MFWCHSKKKTAQRMSGTVKAGRCANTTCFKSEQTNISLWWRKWRGIVGESHDWLFITIWHAEGLPHRWVWDVGDKVANQKRAAATQTTTTTTRKKAPVQMMRLVKALWALSYRSHVEVLHWRCRDRYPPCTLHSSTSCSTANGTSSGAAWSVMTAAARYFHFKDPIE